MKTTRLIVTLLTLTLFLFHPIQAAADGPLALLLTIDGAISPSTQQYLARGIQAAEQRGAEVLILQLNTPGGDLDSMSVLCRARAGRHLPQARLPVRQALSFHDVVTPG
jgi:membrane-bound serine protease (ClpP class)